MKQSKGTNYLLLKGDELLTGQTSFYIEENSFTWNIPFLIFLKFSLRNIAMEIGLLFISDTSINSSLLKNVSGYEIRRENSPSINSYVSHSPGNLIIRKLN